MFPTAEREPASQVFVPETRAQQKIAELLALGGIRIGGDRPWDIRIHDPRLYDRLLTYGSLSAGESYMDGWWDVDALDEFFARILRADPYNKIGHWDLLALSLKARVFNRQTRRHAADVAREHYDLGNDLYEAMLGRQMQYTCAYWPGARDLDTAQENKLHLIASKLHLKRSMPVLELGGGFGGLARFLAAEYGCEVVSYNISQAQVAYGREWCAGLPVRFELRDYRDAIDEAGEFDRVVSIGLCEHIGQKNYRGFLELAHAKLRAGGLFLLHTIGSNQSETTTDPWVDKYIFPNGVIPSIAQLGKAMEGLWVVEDWHNFGPDYDRTLMEWGDNFERAWPRLRERYGERFRRMWRYYLMASAGAFRARKLQLWQMVLSKGDIEAYVPVR